jgi:hypothetical protein
MRFIKSALAAALVVPMAAHAQASDTLSQLGRNILVLGVGLSGTRDATSAPGTTSEHTTGQVGSFTFTRFVRPELAVEISGAFLDADSRTEVARTHTDAIVPILFGLNYAPRALALTTSLRPFVSAAAGPYVHAISDVANENTNSSTQTVLGARFGAGVNWYVASHFMMQLEADYHAVQKFDAVNGVRKDPSGLGMSIGFGIPWGQRR